MNAQTSQYQEQARAAYKRKDYAKALELFNRAIGRSPSVQLYDNRAACHERLEDLQAALKDSKKTIQLAKEDPTGYVRAGKILVNMERKSVALEIYALGLKNVKHVGQGFEVCNYNANLHCTHLKSCSGSQEGPSGTHDRIVTSEKRRSFDCAPSRACRADPRVPELQTAHEDMLSVEGVGAVHPSHAQPMASS
jgi:tetratricopeptide (TPR) repeat protein